MVETELLADVELDTKTKIFSAAAKLFSEKGYNGVSMREISQESGFSKPMIYYYFGSKEEIYKALIDASVEQVTQVMRSVDEQDVSAKQKLCLFTKNFFQMTLKFPEFVRFYTSLTTQTDDVPFIDKVKKEVADRISLLADLIQNAKESGEFGPNLDSRIAAGIYTGTLIHFLNIQFRIKQTVLSDELADQIVNTLFLGFNE